MNQLAFAVASTRHQTVILEILKDAQAWLVTTGINQWTVPFTAEWVDECLARQEFVLGTVDQYPVVVVRLTSSDPTVWGDDAEHAMYIHSLAVRRGWQGRGFGRNMLDVVEEFAATSRCRSVRLDCMADNERLCHYYEQAGFVAGRVKEFPSGRSTYRAQLFEKSVIVPPSGQQH